MKYYKFDTHNGNIYIGSRDAQLIPKTTRYMGYGRYETPQQPPYPVAEGSSAFFDTALEEWYVQENNIGNVVFDKITKETLVVDYFGPVKQTHTVLEPTQTEVWVGDSWSTDKDLLIIKAKLMANMLRESVCDEPITITTVGEDEAIFNVSGNAKFDVVEACNIPELFPQVWRCENGNFTVTQQDIIDVKTAYITRRSITVATYGALKDTGFDAMTLTELQTWVDSNTSI